METVDSASDPVDNAIDVPLPIEGLPPVGPRKRIAPAREASRQPVYRRLPRAVHRCDDCMANHQDDPLSPLSLPGCYARVVVGEGFRVLCHEHVQHWRDRDALPPLEVVSS